MTYYIWYKDKLMFDIDVYVAATEKYDDGTRKYYTEIKPSLIPDGVSYYVFDNIKTKEELDEFIQLTTLIKDLRATLFEGYPSMDKNWENMPQSAKLYTKPYYVNVNQKKKKIFIVL